MKSTKLLLVLLAAALLFTWGCERNVTNEVDDPMQASGCFGCHNDVDGRLQQAEGEWNNSTHASGRSIDYTNRGGAGCPQCHDHQGFVDFQTTGTVNPPYENVSAIHCFTCHAPHSTGTLELRASDPVTLPSGATFDAGSANLCANCHHARDAVTNYTVPFTLPSRWGPHSSLQSDMIRGTGGYQFAGYTYTQDPHYTAVPEACLGCHMGNPQTHAGYELGGHSFNMREHSDTSVTLAPQCTQCHAQITTTFDVNIDSVDVDGNGTIEGYQTEYLHLLEQLHELLVAGGLLNSASGLPVRDRVVGSADSLGALWNFFWCEEDQSKGIHNWDYSIGLLKSSINFLRTGDPNNPGTPGAPRGGNYAIRAH